jgi:hypothetical protein
MATGNIRGGKRNYARPTLPITSTATTSADTSSVAIAYTPATLGAAATSYVITADNPPVTVTRTVTTSGTNVSITPGGTYAVTIAGQNYNGLGPALTINNALVIPSVYDLAQTFNASGTYTIPTGITKLAGYAIGAGGGGGGSNAGGGGSYGSSGGGGGSGAIVGFIDFTVTSGQTVTVTVGTGGNAGATGNAGGVGGASIVAYGGTDIATANGGTGGNGGTGSGGGGGSASSNVASPVTIAGMTGGRGTNQNSPAPQNGSLQSSNTNITGSSNIIGLLPSNTDYGSGAGGAVRFVADTNGAGGSGNSVGDSQVTNASNGIGSGGSGGAGGYYNSPAVVGQAGFRGQVILYIQ